MYDGLLAVDAVHRCLVPLPALKLKMEERTTEEGRPFIMHCSHCVYTALRSLMRAVPAMWSSTNEAEGRRGSALTTSLSLCSRARSPSAR